MPTFVFNKNNRNYSIANYKNEEWKLLNNISTNNKYYISNYGRVKSDTNKGIRIMKVHKANGYYRVQILHKMYFIHRLVAIYFIDNPNNYEQVNHKDFNRCNNCLENLEWVSHNDNIEYSKKSNRFKTEKPLRKAYTFTNVFNGKSFTILGINNVAKHFGIKADSLKAIRNHANTGDYVKTGVLKNLKIDVYDLKVQRLEGESS